MDIETAMHMYDECEVRAADIADLLTSCKVCHVCRNNPKYAETQCHECYNLMPPKIFECCERIIEYLK